MGSKQILQQIIAFISGRKKTFDNRLFIIAIVCFILALIYIPKNNTKFLKTEIVFQQWWEEKMPPHTLKELINEFESVNTDIKIKIDTKTQDEVKNNLFAYIKMQKESVVTETKAKKEVIKLPDIIAFDPMWIDNPDDLEFLETLTDYFTEDYTDNIIDKKSLLINSFINVLYYNIPFLSNANFDRPPKTQADFLKYARAIKEQNKFAYSLSSDYFNEIFPWLVTSGVDFPLIKDDSLENNRFNFASSKTFSATLDFFNTLKSEEIFNYNNKLLDADEKIAAFCSEKVPMIIAPSYELAKIKQINSKLNFSITTVPYSDEYPPKTVFFVTNKNIALLSSSKNKDAAVKFMDFLLQKKQELFLYFHSYPDSGIDGGKNNAVNIDGDNELLVTGQQKIIENPLYIKLKGMYKTEDLVFASSIFKSCTQAEKKFNKEIDLMFNNGRSSIETAKAIQKNYEKKEY
ncbi:MAG: hypothetical protein Ta2F_08020 [Termitinemataceae bacterium]|nr:MAG: hypothetical protein Ta2F_08020 [Termitinemataceae bacterium]